MVAKGLGLHLHQVPTDRMALYRILDTGKTDDSEAVIPALSYDLTFPEVFYPYNQPENRQGFHAVLGNPPWDRVRPFVKEFFARYDLAILTAINKVERDIVEKTISSIPTIRAAFIDYSNSFEEQGHAHDRLYQWQEYQLGEISAGRGNADNYILFAERGLSLTRPGCYLGNLFPSGFHANEGATGIRYLFIVKNNMICCFSFENKYKLFDIDSRFKFALVTTQKAAIGTQTNSGHLIECAFYLTDDRWLESAKREADTLKYSVDFVNMSGGGCYSLMELRSHGDYEIANDIYRNSKPLKEATAILNIELGVQADMTRDMTRFALTSKVLPDKRDPRDNDVLFELIEMGYLVLHEGKTFHQYDDHWGERPRYLVELSKLRDKPEWLMNSRYYRLAFRGIARSNDERTSIMTLLPPGSIFGNSAPCERAPQQRGYVQALLLVAIANSYSFDWMLRQKASANVNLFILNGCPVPNIISDIKSNVYVLLSHCALRMIAAHEGYRDLWEDQIGTALRENDAINTLWPIFNGENDRWIVRAVIDAVVADAYGLKRAQYAHVLSSFSHKSYPKAPELCLSMYDELKSIGLDAFTKKHDPYWDIPINENLPTPVIELPVAEEHEGSATKRVKTKLAGEQKVLDFAPRAQRQVQSKAVYKAVAPSSLSKAADPIGDHENYDRLLQFIESKGAVSNLDAQAHLGLMAAEVRKLLKMMLDEDKIVEKGQARGRLYYRKRVVRV